MKQWVKRSLAIALAACMMFGLVGQLVPAVVKKADAAEPANAAEANGYRLITIGDFGLTEKATFPQVPDWKEYSYGELNGTYLNVDITFGTAEDAASGLDYAAVNPGGWGGFRINVVENRLCIWPCGNMNGPGILTNGEFPACPDYSLEDLGISSWTETFNMKIAVKYNSLSGTTANGVTINTWAGKNQKADGYAYATQELFGNTIGVHATSTGSIKLETPAEVTNIAANNRVVTPEDFDLGFGTYRHTGVGTLVQSNLDAGGGAENLDGVTFHAKVKFEGTDSFFNIGSYGAENDMEWEGIRFGRRSLLTGDQLMMYDTGLLTEDYRGTEEFFDMVTFTPEIALGDATKSLVGTELDLKISLNYIDKHNDGEADDLQIGVWFNGKLYNNEYYVMKNHLSNGYGAGNNFGIGVSVAGDAVTVENADPDAEAYPNMTMWDYGLEDGTMPAGKNAQYQNTSISSLDKTSFTAEFKFTPGNTNGIRIGGWDADNAWYGMQIWQDDNYTIKMQDVARTHPSIGGIDQSGTIYTSPTSLKDTWVKISVRFRVLGTSLFATYTVNDAYSITKRFDQAGPYAGNWLVIYGGANAPISYRSVGDRKVTVQKAVTYDLRGREGFLVNGQDVYVDGKATANGTVISQTGDYVIEKKAGTKRVKQTVSLYRVGDIYLDNIAGSNADHIYLKEYLAGERTLTKAQLQGADLTNDEVVDEADLAEMEYIRANGDASAEARLNEVIYVYYPPALSYDYLGGDEVMPIYGFFGPTPANIGGNPNNQITDKTFGYMKEAGVNLVSYTPVDAYNYTASNYGDIKDILAMAEKYGIGYYITDARLNTAVDINRNVLNGAALTPAQLADKLSDYSYYESYLGTEICDEPSTNDFTAANKLNGQQAAVFPEGRLWKYFKDVSANLNKYVNTQGFVNHAPSDAPWNIDYYYSSGHAKTAYQNYFKEMAGANPQVFSMDHYPFQDTADEGTGNATSFFKSMLIQRQKAIEYNIPFWTLMAVGGDFTGGTVTAGMYPTNEETKWNANIILALGAKGLGYFTLAQYKAFIQDDVTGEVTAESLKKNSIIDYYGNKVEGYFDLIKGINTHVQAVDDVLMKSRSKGVVITGGTAWNQIKLGTDDVYSTGAVISHANTNHLAGVSGTNNTAGAVIGCFDYKRLEAYYVVNYDVTAGASQNVTLTYDTKYNVRIVQNGATTRMQASSNTISVPSGEGVLVVLESAVQPEDWEVAGNWENYEISHMDFAASGTHSYITDGKKTKGVSTMAATGVFNGFAAYENAAAKPSTINGTTFSTDITFHGDAYIRYGGKPTGGWWGLQVYPVNNGAQLEIGWAQDNVAPANKYIEASSVGLSSFLDKEFNLKLEVNLVDADNGGKADDIRLGVYINGVFATGNYMYWNGYGEHLGNELGVVVNTADAYITLDTPDVTPADHEMITTTDFGIGDAYTTPDILGTYGKKTLDGTAFSTTIDFKNANNSIIFGGRKEVTDGWVGLKFYQNAPGSMILDTVVLTQYAGVQGDKYGYNTSWGYTIPTSGEFDLRVVTDYIDYDRDGYKDDVKLRIWVDNEPVHGHFFLQDAVEFMGNTILLHAPVAGSNYSYTQFGDFTVKAAPYEEKLGDAAINMDKVASYTVPGTSTTYDKAGAYAVSFKENQTTRKGNVILYRDGDINVDGNVSAADLIRAKKTLPVLSLNDINTSFKGGYIPEATEVRGTFDGVSTLIGTAVEFKQIFSSSNGNVRLGGASDDSWFGFFLSYDNEAGKVKAEYWTPEGTRIVDEHIDNTPIAAGEEHVYRVEITAEGNDVIFTVYVDGVYGLSATAAGQKSNLSNRVLAYTAANSPFSLKDAATDVVADKAADIDNDGSTANATDLIQSVLVGENVEKNVTFGVISDIHLLANGKDSDRQIRFKKALNYYRANGAEVIIMNGDVSDLGTEDSYDELVEIVNEVYGDIPTAAWPQFVITADNHEYYEAWTWISGGTGDWDAMKRRFASKLSVLDSDLNGTNLNTSVEVGGYTFIGMSADSSASGPSVYTSATLSWLETELAAAAAKDAKKPIFVAIHQPPQNTVSASDGADGSSAYKSILAKYPQVVLFSSHTHAPLEDEHSIYQKDYTVVNTSSLYYVGGLGRDGQGSKVTFANVDAADTTSEIYNVAQALLVRAKGAKVDIQRYNVLENEQIKDNWVIADATNKAGFTYTLDRFASMTEKPVFASDATGKATWKDGTCTMKFSAATHSDFVYYYEVTAGGTTYNLLSDFYQGIPQMTKTCEFKLSGIAEGASIKVRAVDAYGNKSASLTIN